MYLALEGIDTAGKTTQIDRLRLRFSDALFTREPGGTPAGEAIRSLIIERGVTSELTELLLFLADRAEHVERVIRPNRERLIISDRSVVSGLAYAMVRQPLDTPTLLQLHRLTVQETLPDHVVILRLDRSELQKRLDAKSGDRIEARGSDYLMRIQEHLITAVELLQLPCTILDAATPPSEVTAQIAALISPEGET